jgi:hypothetical protein
LILEGDIDETLKPIMKAQIQSTNLDFEKLRLYKLKGELAQVGAMAVHSLDQMEQSERDDKSKLANYDANGSLV